jgi:prephenate dehydrogenase
MMMDILLTNSDAVVERVDRLRGQLDQLSQALAEGDEEQLRRLLGDARNRRRSLYR